MEDELRKAERREKGRKQGERCIYSTEIKRKNGDRKKEGDEEQGDQR